MGANERIRQYIKSNGMTYSFVANRAGIGIKKFSRFMTSQQPMTTDDYEQICNLGLKVDPSTFYTKKFLEMQNH